MRELANLDGVERLLQDQHAIRLAERLRHLLPAVVGIRGADHDADVGILLQQPRRRLNAVDARRHSHVDEYQRVRLAVRARAHAPSRWLPRPDTPSRARTAPRSWRGAAVATAAEQLLVQRVRARRAPPSAPPRILRKSSWIARLSSTIRIRRFGWTRRRTVPESLIAPLLPRSRRVAGTSSAYSHGYPQHEARALADAVAVGRQAAVHLLRGVGAVVQAEAVAGSSWS